ncbi:MAG: Tim44 domain-containing protein [Burkholderiales bacterium]|nr:Tim44 domain-containing protein [Burkholderiales bacterium]
MKHLLSTLMLSVLALAFVAEDAEARRLGGARSFGAQRSIAPSKSVQQTPPSQAAPAAAGTNTAAATKPAGNRWLGPIAGLAAGLGLGWLIGQGGFGGMLGTVLIMALVGFAVVSVMRLLARPRIEGKMQYAGMGNAPGEAPALSPGANSAPDFGAQLRPSIPEGFDAEGFLRQAKLNFVKMQAVHDGGKLGELREFTTDAMFESIKQDLLQHGSIGQQTDVVTLDAELLEVLTEGDTHWASVRFSGMIRESPAAQPEDFQEIWNLAKPTSGKTGWLLAGIQQMQ